MNNNEMDLDWLCEEIEVKKGQIEDVEKIMKQSKDLFGVNVLPF